MQNLKLVILAGFFILLSGFVCFAQQLFVTRTVGEGSDVINGLIGTPDGKLFAGTDNGLFVSTDDGLSWEKVNSVLANAGITALKYYNNMIYAASDSGFFRSLDNGKSWILLNPKIGIRSMAFTPGDVIYADGWDQYNNLKILVSFDNGKTWMESYDKPSNLKIQDNPRGDIFRKGDYFIYRLDYYKSPCYSSYCWQYCTNGYDFGEARSFVILSDDYMLSSTDKAIMYSIYRGGAWGKLADESFGTLGADNFGRVFGDNKISLDSGKTWKVYFTDSTFKNMNLIYSPKKGYVYYTSSTNGIKFTTDDGLTWHRKTHKLAQNSINEMRFLNNILYAATDKGMYFSKDRTLSWYPLNNGLNDKMLFKTFEQKSDGDLLAYIEDSGFQTYSFANSTWQKNSSQIQPKVRKILKATSGNIFAATDGGVYVSLDNGNNWTELNVNITAQDILSITQGTDGKIYIGSQSGFIYSMELLTQQWSVINGGNSLGYPVTSLSQNPKGDLFAATSGGGIFKQKAGGDHFVESNLFIGDYELSTVFAPTDDYVLTGRKYGNYAYSSEDGSFWSGTIYYDYFPKSDKPVTSIISDGDDNFYLSEKNTGILVMKNLYTSPLYRNEFVNTSWNQRGIHSSDIKQVKFLKKDSVFITAGSDGFVRFWRMQQNSYYSEGIFWLIKELKMKQPVSSFDLSKDEKRILIGTCSNDTVRTYVYDLENEKYLAQFIPGISTRNSTLNYNKNIVKYSNDESYIINSAIFDYSNKGTTITSGDLSLWETNTYGFVKDLKTGFVGAAQSIAVPTSGTNIAITCDSAYQVLSPKPIDHFAGVAMIDIISGNLTFLKKPETSGGNISNVFISKDNSIMIARCADTMYVWDFPSGNLKSAVCNSNWKFSNVMLSDNNVYLLGVQELRKEMQIWALNSQRYYMGGYNGTNSVDISEDSRTFLLANSNWAYWTKFDMVTPVEEEFAGNNDLIINPKPAKDFLEISYSPSINRMVNHTVDGITIYDVFGEKLVSSSHYSILTTQYSAKLYVSCLPPGIYFVRVGDRVGKFIKIEN